MQAGMKREWAQPMNPRKEAGKPWGNWKGKGEIFNITGAQPGFHYTIGNEETVDGQLYRGYKIVSPTDGDPEKFIGYGRVHARGGTTNSEMKLGRYYLLKIPTEKYAELRARARQRRAAAMDVPTQTILSRNPVEAHSVAAYSPRYVPRDGNFFFKDPEHGDNGYKQVEMTNGEG